VLCDQAARFTPPAIAPDLGTARNLLTGALQSILLSVDSNAKHLSDAGLRSDIEREREHLIELAKNHQSW